MEDIYSFAYALKARKAAKDSGQTFVLTNGCFDVVHAGHAYSLNKAAEYGDVFGWQLIQIKASKTLKGRERPINCQDDRGYLINSFQAVSGVFFFEKLDLANEINHLMPDVYIKSSDYTYETLNKEERKPWKKLVQQFTLSLCIKNSLRLR